MASSGTYGCKIPANINADDVDIFYSYRKTLNDTAETQQLKKLSSSILVQTTYDRDGEIKNDNLIEGLYNLKLPVEFFNKKGYYTIYIKPKEYDAVISDVSVLNGYQDIRGFVIDTESISDINFRNIILSNNDLVGYRVIYYKNGKRQDFHRIITSNNRCEPVIQNVSGTNGKLIQYRFNNNSSLVFITVTPSVAPTFNADAVPFIGSTAQKISFVNTKFEPIMIELEMVDHDADTISTMLEGSQLRNLDNGLVTTFNEDNEIYAQHEHYSLKNTYTGDPIYEVKKNKELDIDFTQTIEDK